MSAITSFSHGQPGHTAYAWRSQGAWRALAELDTSRWQRAVVVAAHPDDETLGAGGIIARLVDRGIAVDGLVLTHGEASHPRSPTVTPADLGVRRAAESRAAWAALGADPERLSILELPDGALGERIEEVAAAIVRAVAGVGAGALDEGRSVIVAPYAGDGHPDHEAAAMAAARAARRTDADLLEFPIWWWQWADPSRGFPGGFCRMTLTDHELTRKSQAVRCHRTQVAALSPAPGDEVMLGRHVLQHALADEEVFRLTVSGSGSGDRAGGPRDTALDDLHRIHDEPWDADTSWYEVRKRGLLMSMLPRRRYRHGVEVGCSTGALSSALARRCDALSVIDASPQALAAAERRLLQSAPVSVECLLGSAPATWPAEPVDLAVISEVGYFLSPQQLRSLLDRLAADRAATPDHGLTVVLAHWRHPIDGWPMDAADVHAAFTARADLPPLVAEYRDTDVEMLVLADAGWWGS